MKQKAINLSPLLLPFKTTSRMFAVLSLIPPDVLLCDRHSSVTISFSANLLDYFLQIQ
ncbi:MAG: hypothetical protein RM338_00020 [Nostoc sp. DedQUE12a]|nr:hypothetical protein [Nostoc sp. DedQUE12a]